MIKKGIFQTVLTLSLVSGFASFSKRYSAISHLDLRHAQYKAS
jgi:hypothetical protein